MATEAQILSYINYIAPLCQKYAKKHNVKICSPAIAQALQESLSKSSNGLSTLANKYHNHQGLKCGKYWLEQGKPSICLKTGEEYTVGTITQINDYFRVFKDDEEGINGYYDFLEMKRYQNLKSITNPLTYLQTVKADGYCTSSTYVTNCYNKIKKYNLTRFDNLDSVQTTSTTTTTPVTTQTTSTGTYKVGATYTTTANLFVRCEPKGEKKLFSELTANAKSHAYNDGTGHAILKKGTRVTCKSIKTVGKQTWFQIPSGYICANDNGKVYIV